MFHGKLKLPGRIWRPMLSIYAKKPEILVDQTEHSGWNRRVIRNASLWDQIHQSGYQNRSWKNHTWTHRRRSWNNWLNFDPSLGEIIVETKNPVWQLEETARFCKRSSENKVAPSHLEKPPIRSKIVTNMRHYLHSESKKGKSSPTIGERIFRLKLSKSAMYEWRFSVARRRLDALRS